MSYVTFLDENLYRKKEEALSTHSTIQFSIPICQETSSFKWLYLTINFTYFQVDYLFSSIFMNSLEFSFFSEISLFAFYMIVIF